MHERNVHYSYCGHALPPAAPWPRTCAHRGQVSDRNQPQELAFTLHSAAVKEYFDGRRALPGCT